MLWAYPESHSMFPGSNTGAQALYRSLGYGVVSMGMHKLLASSGVA